MSLILLQGDSDELAEEEGVTHELPNLNLSFNVRDSNIILEDSISSISAV